MYRINWHVIPSTQAVDLSGKSTMNRPVFSYATIDLRNEEIAKQLNDKILKAEPITDSEFMSGYNSYSFT